MDKLNNRNVLIVKNCNGPFSVWWWHTVKMASNKRWSICIDLMCWWIVYFEITICVWGLRTEYADHWADSQVSEIYLMSIFCYFSFCEIVTQRSPTVWIQYLYGQNDAMLFRVFFFYFSQGNLLMSKSKSLKQRYELYEAHGWTVQRMKRKIASYKVLGEYFIFYGIYEWQFCVKYISFSP